MAAESDHSAGTDWPLPEPRWQRGDLGSPIPDSPHALSVCMPLWEHNVGYEEGDSAVVSVFRSGYPRFFFNPLVTELRGQAAHELAVAPEQCLLVPTQAAALRCAEYVPLRSGATCSIRPWRDLFAVVTESSAAKGLTEFWQHSGEIISSRAAQASLAGQPVCSTPTPAKTIVRERLAAVHGVSAGDVFLFPSGMAAIYAAWRLTQSLRPGSTAQFGFPYVDTFKILERFSGRSPWFFPRGGAEDLKALEDRLSVEPLSALFCEVPGNPLLNTPDLQHIAALSAEHDFPVVVDDTLGAIINLDIADSADLIATSLTKFFSGGGDVLAGALIVNPQRPRYNEMHRRLAADYEDCFCDDDAAVLERNSRDFPARIERINSSALALAHRLTAHPLVEQVFYPATVESRPHFDAMRRDGGGYGGLMSLQLRDGTHTAPQVYDALQVSKGPNLGTNFTLCCPYTILAHYDELPFAEAAGVSAYLLRLSVGLEPPGWVEERVLAALDAAQ